MIHIWKIIPLTITLSWSSLGLAANCSSALHNNTVNQLNIPAGATCTVSNSSVEGDVSLQKGASLILNSSSIQGSIHANQAKAVRLINSCVSGDVHASQAATTITLEKSVISGDIHCASSTRLQVNQSSIEGQKIGQCRSL